MKPIKIIMAIISIVVIIGALGILSVSLMFASTLAQTANIDASTAEAFGSDLTTIQETTSQLLVITNIGIIWSILAIILGSYMLYLVVKNKIK